MEIFKTDILKKEFEKFQKENIVEILKCGYSKDCLPILASKILS